MNASTLDLSHEICQSSSTKSSLLDSLFFPVEIYSLPNESLFPNLSFGQRFAQVVYLPFTEKIVNFSGNNYKLTTNQDFFVPIYDELAKTFGSSSLKIKALNEDDSRFCVDFVIDCKNLLVGHNDVVCLMVRARNSYDSTLPASIEFLAYRQICSNGLCAWQTFNAPGLKKGFLKHHVNMSKLINGLGSSLSTFQFNTDIFQPFIDRVVSVAEREQIIEKLKSVEGALAFPKKLISEVPFKISEEMAALGSSTLSAWQLYNGFNYFLSHDSRINLKNHLISQIDINVKGVIAETLNIPSLN
jgi:hypothetical protein